MRTRFMAAVASLGLVVGAVALPTAATATTADSSRSFLPFSFTRLTGAAEVPGPGDPDARGFAFVRWDTTDGTVCYNVFIRRIAPATAAHIHVGDENTAGPVVQPLEAPTDGYSAGCVDNDALAAALDSDPGNYYVNVHNVDFPAGAARGQLD
ncbi:CHRD domain-containing protein [Mycetocola miduiensis]|uniref:CHRD domain-containing protein n=1 Tax=Mycetocola miduiensis TaxID=995034 RepID=A0A1I5CR00_9MICO|nr:CHRD domain-containing protein [Mycetocola miduiensis]SFN89388.1 CHRD domain-containing protein [Mycetocola miduiensis]